MKLIADRLSFRYSETGGQVFDTLSASVTDFTRLALVGRSGSGKSTLLKLLGGALEAQSGDLAVEPTFGSQVRYGYIHQEIGLLPWLSVAQNGRLGARFSGDVASTLPNGSGRQLLYMRFGLNDHKDRLPKSLSGGMKQRLALVNALTSGSNVLLLDEAFSASDVRYRDAMFTELRAFAPQGGNNGVIFISHDIADVLELSDMALCLPNRAGNQIRFIDARHGWTSGKRKQLGELMLGEA
jgi:ABC-type nitrate/sulfonate/bicarbonate transport system ATPase subunit